MREPDYPLDVEHFLNTAQARRVGCAGLRISEVCLSAYAHSAIAFTPGPAVSGVQRPGRGVVVLRPVRLPTTSRCMCQAWSIPYARMASRGEPIICGCRTRLLEGTRRIRTQSLVHRIF